ncbi:restriction endonuclease [Paenibacillus sp. 19GGS1-52]|uniref:restriction endonuclease n=1 Tax=Paenibacillus sp. 19GGS1-52 TaxID=2758563 RepID=UPI001EFA6536|nr:restriction endonuclease [Paenibacillus sp. 19GGS1-52]ULO04820.1 restriction endonuclease [Paenibacillus sp. 19GGS1-52]
MGCLLGIIFLMFFLILVGSGTPVFLSFVIIFGIFLLLYWSSKKYGERKEEEEYEAKRIKKEIEESNYKWREKRDEEEKQTKKRAEELREQELLAKKEREEQKQVEREAEKERLRPKNFPATYTEGGVTKNYNEDQKYETYLVTKEVIDEKVKAKQVQLTIDRIASEQMDDEYMEYKRAIQNLAITIKKVEIHMLQRVKKEKEKQRLAQIEFERTKQAQLEIERKQMDDEDMQYKQAIQNLAITIKKVEIHMPQWLKELKEKEEKQRLANEQLENKKREARLLKVTENRAIFEAKKKKLLKELENQQIAEENQQIAEEKRLEKKRKEEENKKLENQQKAEEKRLEKKRKEEEKRLLNERLILHIEKTSINLLESQEVHRLVISFIERSMNSEFLSFKGLHGYEDMFFNTYPDAKDLLPSIVSKNKGNQSSQWEMTDVHPFQLFTQIIGNKHKFKSPEECAVITWKMIRDTAFYKYATSFEEEYGHCFSKVNINHYEKCIDAYFAIPMLNHTSAQHTMWLTYYLTYKRGLTISYLEDIYESLVKGISKKHKAIQLEQFEQKLLSQEEESYFKIVDVDLLSGHDFEVLIQRIFIGMGYKAHVTKGSGDQGVDVIAERMGRKIGIQTKCYTGKVNNTAIQEVVAGIGHYGLDQGMVITNSYFTDSARELAATNHVVLWDRNILSEKLEILKIK